MGTTVTAQPSLSLIPALCVGMPSATLRVGPITRAVCSRRAPPVCPVSAVGPRSGHDGIPAQSWKQAYPILPGTRARAVVCILQSGSLCSTRRSTPAAGKGPKACWDNASCREPLFHLPESDRPSACEPGAFAHRPRPPLIGLFAGALRIAGRVTSMITAARSSPSPIPNSAVSCLRGSTTPRAFWRMPRSRIAETSPANDHDQSPLT
jgi:hypothetical protein